MLSVPDCIIVLCGTALSLRSMAGDIAKAWAKSAVIIVVILLCHLHIHVVCVTSFVYCLG
jgi:hypothetical protein